MVVAICDSDLIGKKFEDEKRKLDLTTSFFDGDEKSEDEVKEIIELGKREDASFNIVGDDSVKLAKEGGIVDEEGVCEVGGVEVGLVLL